VRDGAVTRCRAETQLELYRPAASGMLCRTSCLELSLHLLAVSDLFVG
jgi:hypothetical protein